MKTANLIQINVSKEKVSDSEHAFYSAISHTFSWDVTLHLSNCLLYMPKAQDVKLFIFFFRLYLVFINFAFALFFYYHSIKSSLIVVATLTGKLF